jgi:hypothetical protein
VSPSKNPGSSATSSLALRMELRSSGDGVVAALPLSRSVALAGARYRSIVAALIASSAACTAGL